MTVDQANRCRKYARRKSNDTQSGPPRTTMIGNLYREGGEERLNLMAELQLQREYVQERKEAVECDGEVGE